MAEQSNELASFLLRVVDTTQQYVFERQPAAAAVEVAIGRVEYRIERRRPAGIRRRLRLRRSRTGSGGLGHFAGGLLEARSGELVEALIRARCMRSIEGVGQLSALLAWADCRYWHLSHRQRPGLGLASGSLVPVARRSRAPTEA